MWSLAVSMSVPINKQYDYRLQITATRDAEAAPQPEYDTAAIFLWQKDELHPEDTPQVVEYFTNVCSIADLTLKPISGGTDLQYRRDSVDMIFRSEALMMKSFELIMNDIEELKQTITAVNNVVTDPVVPSPHNFITTWETTTPNETITLPATGTNDTYINWGDGTIEQCTTPSPSHEYAVAGQYDVLINGTMTKWFQNNTGDKLKIIDIKQWGTNVWEELISAFWGCSNMTITATDAPDTSLVLAMTHMFHNCSSIVTLNAAGFDVSQVTVTFGMFANCTSLTTLDVSNWDMQVSRNLSTMFFGCTSLEELDVSGWLLTTRAEDLRSMFYNCSSLALVDVSNWNVVDVEDMGYLFYNCSFDIDISGFVIESLLDATNIFRNSDFSITNYDALLVAWEGQPHNNDVPLHAGTAKYSAGAPATARAALIADGWIITDGGQL